MCVAITRNVSNAKFYNNLELSKTEDEIHKIAKTRYNNSKDMTSFKYIKDGSNKLITDDEKIKSRWVEYYKDLLNVHHPRTPSPSPPKPVSGPIPPITVDEIHKALHQMKSRKATCPDEIPAEVWKTVTEGGIPWLQELYNKRSEGNQIPNSWRNSFLVPFYKGKGDVRDCGN